MSRFLNALDRFDPREALRALLDSAWAVAGALAIVILIGFLMASNP